MKHERPGGGLEFLWLHYIAWPNVGSDDDDDDNDNLFAVAGKRLYTGCTDYQKIKTAWSINVNQPVKMELDQCPFFCVVFLRIDSTKI